MDALTLDQFSTFAAVADEGSFAAAARRMGRAQSAITYAIQRLEEQTGASLFDRSSYRPQLTAAGLALLPHARRILTDLSAYRVHAKAMSSGVEAEIRMALPGAMPPTPLVAALCGLRRLYPSVRVRIAADTPVVAGLRGLEAGTFDVAVVLDSMTLPVWFRRMPCAPLRLVVVAARSHPLAGMSGPLGPDDLADHLQIVVASRMEEDAGKDHGMVAVDRWHVTDYATKRQLLLAGLGWGSMPFHCVTEDLASGALVQLVP